MHIYIFKNFTGIGTITWLIYNKRRSFCDISVYFTPTYEGMYVLGCDRIDFILRVPSKSFIHTVWVAQDNVLFYLNYCSSGILFRSTYSFFSKRRAIQGQQAFFSTAERPAMALAFSKGQMWATHASTASLPLGKDLEAAGCKPGWERPRGAHPGCSEGPVLDTTSVEPAWPSPSRPRSCFKIYIISFLSLNVQLYVKF